ncbi:hypothetical protein ABK040_012580 [Willaertia magna]
MAAEMEATIDMCKHCFDVILYYLNKRSSTNNHMLTTTTKSKNHTKQHFEEEEEIEDFPCNEKFPLFVTWKKKVVTTTNRRSFLSSIANTTKEESYHLRGCIGTFSALSLSEGLKQYAITAAFKDHRFDPITLDEVNKLKCSVSLLVGFESLPKGNVYDWEIGLHGIRIQFFMNGRFYSATYLPEVAAEQGWSKEEALNSLIRKSGYKGKINSELLKEIELERYRSSKVSLSYEEYIDLVRKEEQLLMSTTLSEEDEEEDDEILDDIEEDGDDEELYY